MTIRMAVSRLQGVGKISGEVKARTLTVEYEPSTLTVNAVREALKGLGYESTPGAETAFLADTRAIMHLQFGHERDAVPLSRDYMAAETERLQAREAELELA